MLSLARIRRRLGSAAGFTLIETLVAMVTGIVVTGALFGILEVTFHQFSRLSDASAATKAGRTTMTHVVDELHSACLASGFTPILEGSSGTKLVFVDAYSENAEIASARKDEIVWTKEAGKESGTLTDFTYPSTGGTSPEFTYSATASPAKGVLIGEHIFKAELEVAGKKESPPFFRYYAYSTKSSTSPSAPSTTLSETPLAEPLTKESALNAASILISYAQAPTDGKVENGRSVSLSTQVTLAFDAPSSETPIQAAPCE